MFLPAISLIALALTVSSCMKQETTNPFLSDYNTPYEIPPFEQIKHEHYMPAFEEGIKQHNAEIAAIVSNTEAPTFDNTILALDQAGELLNKVSYVFGALAESDNDSIMEQIAEQAYPMLSAHSDEILMNDSLFQRVKVLYDNIDSLGLDTAQRRLLEKNYKEFVRAGALLSPEMKDSLKQINQELSTLYLSYCSNILKETNEWTLVIDNKDDLAGLPDGSIAVAAEEAAKQHRRQHRAVRKANGCSLCTTPAVCRSSHMPTTATSARKCSKAIHRWPATTTNTTILPTSTRFYAFDTRKHSFLVSIALLLISSTM